MSGMSNCKAYEAKNAAYEAKDARIGREGTILEKLGRITKMSVDMRGHLNIMLNTVVESDTSSPSEGKTPINYDESISGKITQIADVLEDCYVLVYDLRNLL